MTQFISGAEALARILAKEGIRDVFAYPGTSELAMCDAVLRTKTVNLINGRGDKESAFMAAGGCLLRPTNAAAILHGARGLTNAAGAIADANRNEVGVVFFVGLPSSSSARFLPPHGEYNLIQSIGNFTKSHDEITAIPSVDDDDGVREAKAREYIDKVTTAITRSRTLPLGPCLLGIPQDAAEQVWVPAALVDDYHPVPSAAPLPAATVLDQAAALLTSAQRPVIYVDDFLYKNDRAKQQLTEFAAVVGAPIFQVFYGRGPMLFEKSLQKDNPYFLGCYAPDNPDHQAVMRAADLLITLEDRNMYERVVGRLPDCPKLALTSHPAMTRKNEYLAQDDLLLAGDVAALMQQLGERLPARLAGLNKNTSRCDTPNSLTLTPYTATCARPSPTS